MNVTLGEIVYSRAGRDSGRKFVVTGVADAQHVYVCDGDLRRVEKPKKKKLKHLDLTGQTIETLRDKLANKTRITNAEIRKALAAEENKLQGGK